MYVLSWIRIWRKLIAPADRICDQPSNIVPEAECIRRSEWFQLPFPDQGVQFVSRVGIQVAGGQDSYWKDYKKNINPPVAGSRYDDDARITISFIVLHRSMLSHRIS